MSSQCILSLTKGSKDLVTLGMLQLIVETGQRGIMLREERGLEALLRLEVLLDPVNLLLLKTPLSKCLLTYRN